jgi:putative transposase
LPLSATPLLHSDQGWQYQMKEYLVLLKEHNITQSISRKVNGLDNSAMENFFGRLKTEMFFGETFSSLTIFNRNLKNAFAISTIEEYL